MKRLAILFVLALPLLAAGQLAEQVNVEVVNVYLSAIDSKGNFVTDLNPEEIVLKDEGVAQHISNFTNFAESNSSENLGEKGIPLTLAFVIDTSNSMAMDVGGRQQKIDIVKNAAFKMADELRPEDKVTLIAFNDHPDEITPLTSNRKDFERDLLFQDVEGGNTALLDSVYYAMEKIKNESGRKIIVLLTDGQDTASLLRLDEVVSNVVASDITILAFGTTELAPNTTSLRARAVLEKLANASGGYAFFPTSLNRLDEVMRRLRAGMSSQYSLGYKPLLRREGWHKIDISTKRHGLKLRYREGYFSGPLD